MMPRRSGLEVLDDMRNDAAFADTAVIVLTAQPAARDEALRGGADMVIEKPFAPDDIARAVERLLADRQ